jgi:hypothetical protein
VAVAVGPLAELQRQLDEAVARTDLTPGDRLAKLRGLRDDLSTLLGIAETYIGDTELLREAESLDLIDGLMQVQENAEMREELLRRGLATEDQLNEAGYVSFQEIERMREEGLLLEFAGEIKSFVEKLHPRDRHGMFAEKPGQVHLPSKGRGGHTTPKVLTTHPQGDVRAPGVRTHEEAAHAAAAEGQLVKHAKGIGQITKVHEGGNHADVQFQHGIEAVPVSELDPHSVDAAMGSLPDKTATPATPRDAAERVAARAQEVEATTSPLLQKVADEAGGKLQGFDFRLKTVESIASKIARKQEKMPLATDAERAATITDSVRYTVEFPPESYVDGTKRTLESFKKQGFDVAEQENFWGGGDAYDGLHVLLQTKDGFRFEVQFHTPESFVLKMETLHVLYERYRESKDPVIRYEVYSEMISYTQKIKQPPGVEALGPIVKQPIPEKPPGA